MKEVIVVNLKTYSQGRDTLRMARAIEKVNRNIIVGVSPTDIYPVSKNTRLRVYSQHVDYFKPGRNTGYILPEAVRESGAVGTFLNHSEHKLSFDVLRKTVLRCKKVGLKTAVFAKNLGEAKKIEKLRPDYIIIEPIELVAGNVSVSRARSGLIKSISKNLKSSFLVGAGIKTKEDIGLAMKLGASGVAFASVITTASNPEVVLRKLLR